MATNPDHQSEPPRYGDGDASFQAAGGVAGIQRLVDDFYALMEQLPEARAIRALHPPDLAVSRDKLARFLCGWLGGPKLFRAKYGPIRLPSAHRPFHIGVQEREAWLRCMERALDRQPYAAEFRRYLLAQLYVAAERIRHGGGDKTTAP